MEWLSVALLVVLGAAWVSAPFIALVQIGRLRRELGALKAKLVLLESSAPSVAPRVAVEPAAPSALAHVASSVAVEPGEPTPPVPAPIPATAPPGRTPAQAERLEDLIGSVWLQNAGAVVLLLGVFFFILWGYTTGRFGPGALVAAGIGIGLASAWRGDRLARSLPRLGHAFIGVGLGAIYLSLYLGHFTLHVLSLSVAFASLLAASALAIGAGLRYRAQAIAAIGVVGAFLPQLLASWIPLKGFSLEPAALLGYVAAVDVLVFALAARSGWSALDLSALALTALVWRLTYPGGAWSSGVTLSLAGLFTGLGLAPLPKLVGHAGRVRAIDLAVVAGAPAGLIFSLWAWLVASPPVPVAQLLLSLGALELLAALGVDSRRTERDLWRPLTGAAVVFFSAGLQRLVGDENLGLVWCVEGVVLVLLGRGPRAGWLRLCGHVVTALAVLVAFSNAAWRESGTRVLSLEGLEAVRGLTIIVALLAGATFLARQREHLAPLEHRAPELWTAAANALLLGWSWRVSDALAHAFGDPSGRWRWGSAALAGTGSPRSPQLFTALLGFAWLAQAASLAWLGSRAGRGFLRFCAYAVAVPGLAVAAWSLRFLDGWNRDQWPVFYPAGLCGLGSVVLAAAVVARYAARRRELPHAERNTPEVCTAGLMLLLLSWSAREAGHVARTFLGVPGESFQWSAHLPPAALERVGTLGAALTSAAWLVEAIVLLALGWFRSAPFLRWAGLALIGATVIKFAFYDLASADVFWRFLTAIAAGAAMLAVSYAYQRRAKRSRSGG